MIVFNNASTMALSKSLDYLGDVFCYKTTNKINLNGRFISNLQNDSSSSYFGVAYAEDGGIWYPYGSSSPLATGSPESYSGFLTFESGLAYISVQSPPSFSSLIDSGLSPLYDIWEEMDNIRDRMKDFQEIFINGVSIGSGRVLSFSFPENKNPSQVEYSVEIETYSSGDLTVLQGGGYQNFNIDPIVSSRVSNISESFDFSLAKDGSTQYSRALSFDVISENQSHSDSLLEAKSFASGIFYGDPVFSILHAQYPSFYQEEGKRITKESYDKYNNSYSFSESFQGPSSGENYYFTNSFSLSVSEDGISEIVENGSVKGVRSPFWDNAKLGYDTIESTSLSRVSDFYYGYVTGCSLNLFRKSSSRVLDKFAGSIDYSFSYSDDPFSSGCFSVTRTLDYNSDQNGLITVSEEGSVSDVCGSNGSERLQNSVDYFSSNISGGVFSRIYSVYTGVASGCGCDGSGSFSGDLRLSSLSRSYSEYNGSFDYSFSYKNDCSSLVDDCFFVKTEREIKDTIHNVFIALSLDSGEVAQKQNTSSLISESQRIMVNSRCSGKGIEDFLEAAKSGIIVPSGNGTYFMNGANYSFNPQSSSFELGVNYEYTGYRPYSNYDV